MMEGSEGKEMGPLEEIVQWKGVLGAMPYPESILCLLTVLSLRQDVKNSFANPSHHDDILPKPMD